MDWNRDGKVDAHDVTLYHTVISNDSNHESSSSSYGSRKSYSSSKTSRPNPTPANSSESGAAGWVVAVIVFAILYFFFS